MVFSMGGAEAPTTSKYNTEIVDSSTTGPCGRPAVLQYSSYLKLTYIKLTYIKLQVIFSPRLDPVPNRTTLSRCLWIMLLFILPSSIANVLRSHELELARKRPAAA
jgi:hypothetical protein